jgi:TatD DNase family protein
MPLTPRIPGCVETWCWQESQRTTKYTTNPMPIFFDTHAHLDYPDFEPDLPQVVARAQAAGIVKIISIGTDLESSKRAIKLAERFEPVYAVVGWHPSDAMAAPDDVRPTLRELAKHPKVVALGETGLDYHRLPSMRDAHKVPNSTNADEAGPALSHAPSPDDEHYKQRQAALFRQHLEVAAESGLNCVVHQRDALEDTVMQLSLFADRVRGVFHCFANDADAMRRILGMNSLVSFTGIATFKNGQNVRETVAVTPLGQFMLETDCPYLAPMPYRGKRCEPGYVKEISETVAKVKGCSFDELSQATCKTAREFFPKLGVEESSR